MLFRSDRFSVLRDVLFAIPNCPTRVMYKANLSWNTLQVSLDYLKERQLINETRKGCRYRVELTPMGEKVRELFDEIMELIE